MPFGPLDAAVCAGTALFILPVLFWATGALLGSARRPHPGAHTAHDERPAAAVLIPAHNEAGGIGRTVRRLLSQLSPGDRILVVADNCTDDTAAEARAAGAEVLERSHPTDRGKGFALDAGVRHLAASPTPPGVLIVLDADCRFSAPGQLDALASAAHASQRPAQAINLVEVGDTATIRSRIAVFAFRVKNLARPLGLRRLGGPCLLTGTGMAFPFELIRSASLASSDLVEDMRLGVDLASAGRSARLCTNALVLSPLAETDSGWKSQRTRWEQGHLRSIAAHCPRLLRTAARHPTNALLALELAVPPLSMLVLFLAAWPILPLLLGAAGLITPTIALLSLTPIALLGIALLAAWVTYGRDLLTLPQLASTPKYAAQKLPIYFHLLSGGERRWVRTER